MNPSHIIRTACILSLFFLFGAGIVRAEDPRFLSVYQSEYGLKLYHDQKYDLAIERFAKAFLLDPQNKTAKETLQKIADAKSEEGSTGLRILRFIDQVEYIDFLTTRYQNLIEENARLLNFLRNNKSLVNDVVMSEKFHLVEKQITDKPSALPRVGLIGFAGDDSQSVNLETVTSRLTRERGELINEVGFWEDHNNQLREFRKIILLQVSAENPLTMVEKMKGQLEEVHQRVEQKDQLLSVQQKNIDYFTNELTAVRNDFTALQEKFKATDVKINELTNKIAGMSVELFEKNKIIGEKDERAADLQHDLNTANEKFNLVQRIIQEKDNRIAALETEMSQLQTNLASEKPSDQQMVKMKGDLKNFESQFRDQLEKSRERLVSLETQYTDLITKYETLQKDMHEKDAQVVALKMAVDQKNKVVVQYRAAFLQTDAKANQLLGMIEIYRGKLLDVKETLNSKENELKQLQGTLFNVNNSTESQRLAPAVNQQQSPSSSQYDLTLSKPSAINHQAR